jgi:hypothetical protein
MGFKSRSKANRKKAYEIARDAQASHLVFLPKQRYEDEWPETWLKSDTTGIWTINGCSVLGFDIDLHTPTETLNCIYGLRLYELDQQGPSGVVIAACLPTRQVQLRPYRAFVIGMIQDMIRSEALPTFAEIWQNLDSPGSKFTKPVMA